MSRLTELIRRDLETTALLIALGAVTMVVSAFADPIGLGHPGFGKWQLSSFVMGALLAMTGLVKTLFPGKRILLQVSAGFYIAVILYIGLWADPCESVQSKVLLDFRSYDWHDFAINTAGFIPLGYLFMLGFGSRQEEQGTNLLKRAILLAGVGSLISLFIEVSQYYLIFGRKSSLFDWSSNTLGTVLGIVAYLVLSEGTGLSPRKHRRTPEETIRE